MNCWPLIVKKRGSAQNGRTQCGDDTNGCLKMLKKDEEKRRMVPVLMEEHACCTRSRNQQSGEVECKFWRKQKMPSR